MQSTIILLNLSHIKLRVCAFYEFLEPWYEQYHRLWGWGGVVICNLQLLGQHLFIEKIINLFRNFEGTKLTYDHSNIKLFEENSNADH